MVVMNLFQTFNLDGSIYVHKLETVYCPLPSEDQSNWQYLFLSQRILPTASM